MIGKYLVLLSTFVFLARAQTDPNKLWFLIEKANLLTCSGPPNQFTLTKDDVSVKDRSGNPVQILEAPGEYFIEFQNIQVKRALPNISGRMASLLQVPLVSTGLVRLDFPYQVIPQTTLVEGYKCDNESGHIFDAKDNRNYCRYCDLCSTSSHVENKLSSGVLGTKYAPKLSQEGSFDRVCEQISAESYKLKRSVVLPDKKELERQANDRYKSSLEGPVLQKLKVGRGKLQVFLNLDSNTEEPVDSNKWYANNRSCSCCTKNQAGDSNCQKSAIELLLGRKSQRCLLCNNEYVKTCLKGSSQRVGCYIVEYNFQVTDNRTEYELFKKKLGVSSSSSSGSSSGSESSSGSTGGEQNKRGSSAGGDSKACVAAISRSDMKRYCTDFEKKNPNVRNYCCKQCSNVCQPSN